MDFVPPEGTNAPDDWVWAYPLSPFHAPFNPRRKKQNPVEHARGAYQAATILLVKKMAAKADLPASPGMSALIDKLHRLPFLLYTTKHPSFPEALRKKYFFFEIDETRIGPNETGRRRVLLPPAFNKICLPFDDDMGASYIPLSQGARLILNADGSLRAAQGAEAERVWRDFHLDRKMLRQKKENLAFCEARAEMREASTPCLPLGRALPSASLNYL